MSDEKSIAAVLKRSKLFSALGDGELSSLIRDSRTAEVSYTAGESIYSDTSYKKALGAVITGCLSVYRPGNGSRVLLNRIPAGGVFGAASLFGAEGMYVTEITAEKDSVIFFVPSEVLGRLITENGEFALSYIGFLTDRIRFLNRRISELSAGGAERKLAKYLLERDSDKPVSMTELASFLGIGRASLYRIIDGFTGNGFIEKNGRNIAVLDRDALCRLI